MIRIAFALALVATQAFAAPAAYRLDTDRSSVRFSYDLGLSATTGSMPVSAADMTLDLADIGRSRVTVTLDAASAQAGVFFATEAMKGPGVLDTARYPSITFRSTRISGTLSAARIDGLVTVRGVTRPLTLTAGLYREQGSTTTDDLTVLLTGTIDRRDFGADGFAAYVGPMIALRILARIEK